jgi:cbb3-type cytochrome oxidase subunit 3
VGGCKSTFRFKTAGKLQSMLSFAALTITQINPPPVNFDDEGQVQNEEDRPAMGSVRVWRTLKLFKDEAFLIVFGFLLQFIAISASMYGPQLTKIFSEAQYVPRAMPLLNLNLLRVNSCALIYSNLGAHF